VRTVIATTGDARTAGAGVAALEAGGNAVDAAVAAALAWPPALTSAGVLVAVGPGMGRGAATFQARVPGFGLSRQSRLRLLSAASPASRTATSTAAQAFVAVLARWGTATLAEVARAASGRGADRTAPPAPHQAALALLAKDGANAFSRGAFAAEAARSLGPLAGGLLTRRDMIETRPVLASAEGPLGGFWLPWPIDEVRARADAREVEGERELAIVVIDRHGAIASVALEAGPAADPELPAVAGVPPNTLLAAQPAARAKKVGQVLPLGRAAAAGGDVALVGLAGRLAPALEVLDRAEAEAQASPPLVEPPPEAGPGLLVVRKSPGGRIDVEGGVSVVRS
jgi:hypothetical protein